MANQDKYYWDDFVREITDRKWVEQAACKGMSIDLFFPDKGSIGKKAKAICATCPVQDECRDYGKTERYGVWGGESRRSRKRTRAERKS